jgi:Mg2+ and Co2+ transporter CorA
MILTQELHVMRAHLLQYAALLEDFRKSVQFVLDTPNPAVEANSADVELLEKECKTLLSQIERLEMSRKMQDNRLGNLMNLVSIMRNTLYAPSFYWNSIQLFARVNIGDSKAMKRLSYLTMIFLPASFVAVCLFSTYFMKPGCSYMYVYRACMG